MIENPILRGFNPDPSILRVGEDYYVAVSTFEWYPGVQIHHSRDLVHWRLLTRPLSRRSQLDMTGNPNSGGVWAPCLSYGDGLFYLVYSDVKSLTGVFKDVHNYLVTAPDIKGPWSDPVYLNGSGFDPSLFHDDDGRKWLVNMQWDHRKGKNPFAGIVIQEYSERERRLVGPIRNVFQGTPLGLTEAPHLYKRNGYYYLVTAEGGTNYEHAVTIARASSLEGPFEVDPRNPILTSVHNPELPLQKAGHASFVETQSGEWYMAHLCSRPLDNRRSVLGRETAIQRVVWTEDGWIRLPEGNEPFARVEAPAIPPCPFETEAEKDDFEDAELGIHFQSLRVPVSEDWLTLGERPGYLRLKGRESLYPMHRQSLIARRQQAFDFEAETVLEFEPETYQQMAGLVYFYNTNQYFYLRVSRDERVGKCLNVIQSDKGKYDELLEEELSVEGWGRCYMKAVVNGKELRFYCSPDGSDWQPVGPVLDASLISDDYVNEYQAGRINDWGFTGAFIGLCAQDLSGRRKHADFDYFVYRESADS